nr:MAG TPA: hypothetical protein [Caudoviricetes sp.]
MLPTIPHTPPLATPHNIANNKAFPLTINAYVC